LTWKLRDRQIPPDKLLHLIADIYAMHKHPKVQRWPACHRRVHMHFIPAGSSWLNLAERLLWELTDKRIRCGVFRRVPELFKTIDEYIRHHNASPKPFVWTKTAKDILAKVSQVKQAFDKTRTA